MMHEVGGDAWMTVVVGGKVLEAEGIYSFRLKAPNDEILPEFTAGSHIDVEVLPGLIRQYSLCNDPQQSNEYEIAVLLVEASRGGSKGMHQMEAGDSVRISVPRNNFKLTLTSGRSILVAGGIGVTPILAMAEELAAQSRPFDLHFCARSLGRAAFVKRLSEKSYAKSLNLYFDSDGSKIDLEAIARERGPDDHMYVCGPSGFMDYILGASERLGWSKDRLHKEYFSAPAAVTEESGAFNVKLASSGNVFQIPKDKTVVQVLAENGIEIPVSCEQGICGTCITRVLSGTIDHRDFILTDAEKQRNDQFTPCCSRANCQLLELDL